MLTICMNDRKTVQGVTLSCLTFLRRIFGRPFSREVIDWMTVRPVSSYDIKHTDNTQIVDIFAFGVHGVMRTRRTEVLRVDGYSR